MTGVGYDRGRADVAEGYERVEPAGDSGEAGEHRIRTTHCASCGVRGYELAQA